MIQMDLSRKAAIALIALAFIIAIALYPQMPDRMSSHWNAKGEADGTMPKFWGLFLMPIILVAVMLLMIGLPLIDPLRRNVERFRKHYEGFILVITAYFFYVYLLMIFWNLGYQFNMTRWMAPAFGVLFYYIGILVENAKRNWFIGIKTPWTLSSDAVWEATHKLAGKLFKAAGAFVLVIMIFTANVWMILLPILIAAFYPVVFSYFEYQKQKQKPAKKRRR